MQERLGDFSIREKNLWFEFMLDIVIAFYYYPKALLLMQAGEAALTGAAMARLVASTVVLAIAMSSVLTVFLHAQAKPEPKDERDRWIEARGCLLAGRVLVAGVALTMAAIVLQTLSPALIVTPFALTPLVIAHCLLIVLMLASLTDSVTRLFLYRMGA